MERKIQEKKGITLISLVITIILLLILAVVAINIAVDGNGLFQKAGQAGNEWNTSVENESVIIGNLIKELNKVETDDAILVTGVTLDKTSVILDIGDTETLVATVTPSNATNQAVTYTTDNATVATVDENGVITALAEGTATITATTVEGGKTADCLVEVDDGMVVFSIWYNELDYEFCVLDDTTVAKGTKWSDLIDVLELNERGQELGYKLQVSEWWENYITLDGSGLGVISPDWDNCTPDDEVQEGKYYAIQAACVFPTSEILVSLTGDIVHAEDLSEGDQIVYCEIETGELKLGTIKTAYIHEKATSFVRYTFEDGSYLEATDYHPIYTKQGWKSLTQINGYKVPEIGDEVKTAKGWKVLSNIETWTSEEDCYDFEVVNEVGETVGNYFANNTLVQGLIRK